MIFKYGKRFRFAPLFNYSASLHHHLTIPNRFCNFLFSFFDYTPAIDGIHEIRLALNVRSIENIKFVKLKIGKTVPWTVQSIEL
jgi:hypothetical protein